MLGRSLLLDVVGPAVVLVGVCAGRPRSTPGPTTRSSAAALEPLVVVSTVLVVRVAGVAVAVVRVATPGLVAVLVPVLVAVVLPALVTILRPVLVVVVVPGVVAIVVLPILEGPAASKAVGGTPAAAATAASTVPSVSVLPVTLPLNFAVVIPLRAPAVL